MKHKWLIVAALIASSATLQALICTTKKATASKVPLSCQPEFAYEPCVLYATFNPPYQYCTTIQTGTGLMCQTGDSICYLIQDYENGQCINGSCVLGTTIGQAFTDCSYYEKYDGECSEGS